jgi:hypothetical protein
MLKYIKQQAVTEFLKHINGTPMRIHWRLLALYDEDTVDLSTVNC